MIETLELLGATIGALMDHPQVSLQFQLVAPIVFKSVMDLIDYWELGSSGC